VTPWAPLIAGFATGLACVWAIRRWKRPAKEPFLAACEYWVYLPGEKLPEQERVMTAMVARNPHSRGGESPVGPREGILFSDIRLSVTLVLRSKNPHAFRPDVFHDFEATADQLAALGQAHSLVKLRYVSEEPLPDTRHLQFLPHMADAYANLGKATAVLDVVAERLFLPGEFHEALGENIDATRPEFHLRIAWHPQDGYATAETKGLLKLGLPELTTGQAQADNRQLLCDVLTEAATFAWKRGEHLDTEIVEYYGDRFEVRSEPQTGRKRVVQIVRFQAVSP